MTGRLALVLFSNLFDLSLLMVTINHEEGEVKYVLNHLQGDKTVVGHPAIWSLIALLVGVGFKLSGWESIYGAYSCWIISAILALFAIMRWRIPWFKSVNNNEQQLMPLTKAVETLIQEGKRQNHIKPIDYDIEMQNDANGYYQPFAEIIAKYVDIYGKRPSASFNKWEIISKDMIMMGVFRDLSSILYFNKEPLFVDLAIRQDKLDKTIQEIMSMDRPFDWLSYEVK